MHDIAAVVDLAGLSAAGERAPSAEWTRFRASGEGQRGHAVVLAGLNECLQPVSRSMSVSPSALSEPMPRTADGYGNGGMLDGRPTRMKNRANAWEKCSR